MRVGSLFSGIGGIDLGLERAGMEIAWQVEIDEWCRRILAKHWPDVERFGDIRSVGAHNLAAVDVLAGGFPCQPVSHAGKRQAQDDARWLWPEYARLVRELRPRYVFVENVPGLLDGPMADVLGDLAACGYDAEWDCIPAAAVGAPHLRDRVWLLAYTKGVGCGPWWAGGSTAGASRQSKSTLSQPVHSVSDSERLQRRCPQREGQRVQALAQTSAWRDIPPPYVCGAVDGIPHRVDRLRGLGNAVVPQIVEWIGRKLLEVHDG